MYYESVLEYRRRCVGKNQFKKRVLNTETEILRLIATADGRSYIGGQSNHVIATETTEFGTEKRRRHILDVNELALELEPRLTYASQPLTLTRPTHQTPEFFDQQYLSQKALENATDHKKPYKL